MILTYKIKHGLDLAPLLAKAKEVAQLALKTKIQSSKAAKHIGLPSAISCQILRKYSRNKKLKKIRRVKLTVPGQSTRVKENKLFVKCVGAALNLSYIPVFQKVNQVEFDDTFAFVSVTVSEQKAQEEQGVLGVDLNATGHIAVMSNPQTGKVWKFGKKAGHIHRKYQKLRTNCQKRKNFKLIHKIKNRESRIVRDINHKISKKIVSEAKTQGCKIVLENLKGIRSNKKHRKDFNATLNSWSFYQLKMFVEYKAKLHGVSVVYVDPKYTSQICSKCNNLGDRRQKKFKCQQCGHFENADVNASFNIGLRHAVGSSRSATDRDVVEGCTDKPKRQWCNDTNLKTLQL